MIKAVECFMPQCVGWRFGEWLYLNWSWDAVGVAALWLGGLFLFAVIIEFILGGKK